MMKQKWERLCSRHRWVPVVVVVLCMIPAFLLAVQEESWFAYILIGLIVAVSLLSGSAATIRLVNTTVKFLQDHCDPHPLLEETTCQLGYVKNRSDRTMLTLNRSAGLLEAGYHNQALEELEALDIHNPAVPISWRYSYYHNLTVAAIVCGQKEKAQVYYQNAIQQFDGLKGKVKETLAPQRVRLSAEICLMCGNFAQAYELLAPMAPDTLQGQVGRAYALARIAVAQGQPDIARVHLDFVLTYGNRLHVVAKAQKLVEEIQKETLSV